MEIFQCHCNQANFVIAVPNMLKYEFICVYPPHSPLLRGEDRGKTFIYCLSVVNYIFLYLTGLENPIFREKQEFEAENDVYRSHLL